jgi:PKD domain
MKLFKYFLLKLSPAIILVLIFSNQAFADHLKGGWIKYEYLGAGSGNTSNYKLTVYQYLKCGSNDMGQIDREIYVGVFDAVNHDLIKKFTISLNKRTTLNKDIFSEGPCINPKVAVCYEIDDYVQTINLPDNTNGYILSVQRCCRISNIINLSSSQDVGITYSTQIPGIIGGTVYRNNSSPVFDLADTVLVCYNSPMQLDFHTTDPDGDSLVYSFCNGLTGGTKTDYQPNPPSAPPYISVPYNFGFSGNSPLGPGVTINSATGLISGNAPKDTGDYVVAVCVFEYRNGIFISQTRKEIHVHVANCQISAALLDPEYLTCNGYDFSFFNKGVNDTSFKYLWDFGVPGISTDTSTLSSPTYIYSDTGIYTIKLKVANKQGCQDSTTAKLGIFPGFIPDFSVNGSCILNPYSFIDQTYGNGILVMAPHLPIPLTFKTLYIHILIRVQKKLH